MSLTLGLTGMDPATEAALKSAFADANRRLHGHWQLLPESEAAHVVVDMDSMYGPMSWLRLHAAGKRVIGLTTAPRTQTDFHLGRPFDGTQVAALLRDIADAGGVRIPDEDAAPVRAAPAAATAERPEPVLAPPAAAAAPVLVPPPAMAASELPKGPTQAPAAVEAAPPTPVEAIPRTEAILAAAAEAAAQAEARAAAAPPPAATPPAPPREPAFADWLAPGALRGRLRYAIPGGDALLIDATARQYHGPALLKPVLSCFEARVVLEDAFVPVDPAQWAAQSGAAGPAQPLQRLQWLGGLLAGHGAILAGQDPDGRYRLTKWPQTEREYPKHFRIATAMMKGPATLPEIADASGIALSDVADFVNANLVTGFAEAVPEPVPEPAEAPRPARLFDRLRGR